MSCLNNGVIFFADMYLRGITL
ncbi:hypothetical protein YPPY34_0978, partial [Yersinia pestis PY-34]